MNADLISMPIATANNILQIVDYMTSPSEDNSLISNSKIDTLAGAARKSGCSINYVASVKSNGTRQEAIQFIQK